MKIILRLGIVYLLRYNIHYKYLTINKKCLFCELSYQFINFYLIAITDISTFTSFGKRATCTVSLAGGSNLK